MPRSATQSSSHQAQHSAHIHSHYATLGFSPEELDALAKAGRRSKPAIARLLGMTRKELLARATRAGVRGRWR
ncbi:hypothetical protein, partial [Pseudomonas citronellolis]|uniref:hypothetical protein n=1 Tax=Pseudomonas citronellolis TaxID=53408 RepID=UPI002A482B3F|nr:hypothetical protein [Pseudomonas citronellolis]